MQRPIQLIVMTVCLAGCSIVNPYSNDFSCPDTFHGRCISVTGAYNQDLKGKPGEVASREEINTCIGGECQDGDGKSADAKTAKLPVAEIAAMESNYSRYKDSLYRRLDHLLREPQTPVVAPPKVLRILFLPYRGQDGEFVMTHHVFFFADDPKWILGNDIETSDE